MPGGARNLRVAARRRLAENVVALDLVDPSGRDLPDWQPGAHVDLVFGPGRIIRQYSLCGDPADRKRWTVAVLKETDGRGGSVYLHDTLAEGSPIEVGPPRNRFALEEDREAVFIAGGIGITPLLPMIRALEQAGGDWQLHYAGRSRASMAFADDLAAHEDGRVFLYPRDEGEGLDIGHALDSLAPGQNVYACGPARLIDEVLQIGAERGLMIHVERFVAPDEPHRSDGPETAFEVEFARSGITVPVPPDRSILECAEAAGVPVVCSCLDGICGTCETRVLDGNPDHRDYVLDKDTKDTMMICVSRARGGRLKLDL